MKKLFLITLSLLLLTMQSCFWAPGMVLDESAPTDGSIDSTGTYEGLTIRLRSISPALLREAAPQRTALAMPTELTQLQPTPYQLGMYDVVTVAVWEHPELSMPLGQYRADLASGQMVDEKGSIFYPYAGLVPSQGLTSGQLREKLLLELSKVLNNPQLDVKVTGFRSQRVFVHGSVPKPSIVPITDIPLTLLDAVNQCGGIQSTGDASQVELTRKGQTFKIDIYGPYPNGTGPESILLQHGDVIRVPSSLDTKVYVMGEVEKQAAVPLVNGKLNLVQALAEVGGISPLSAQSKGIYVIRMADSASIEVYHLNARNPLALALGDQFELKPRDVVFVDATGLARWNRLVSLILPTASLIGGATSTAVNVKTLVK